MIRINVGGTIFCTSKSTLQGAGGMLAQIAERPNEFPQDPYNGIVFLDRNPERFSTLLDICRDAGRPIRSKLPIELLNDVEYLGIMSHVPFRFAAGDEIELTMNGIANIAWIVEITMDNVRIKTHEWNTIQVTHDAWDGTKWEV